MTDVRSRILDEAKAFGIEIVDVRIKRVDFVAAISDAVYRRMQSERQQVANELRSTGAADAEKIRADADRQRSVIVAEAYRDAQKVKGEGDAKASALYADAFGRDPQFAQFYRSLEAYRASFRNKSDIMVLDPSSDFFRTMRSGASDAPRGRACAQVTGETLVTALALLLIAEGLLPLLSPRVVARGVRAAAATARWPTAVLRLDRCRARIAADPGLSSPSIQCRFQQRRVFEPMTRAWLLPEQIADVLPSQARRVEELRRTLIDRARGYGYELVQPPLVEHLESLLTGTGAALDLKTFKLVDQLSGRTLGLRADTTPQVARIDAHLLNREGVARLAYCGPVLHARADGALASRELLQFGAEVYGHAGLEADLEVIDLALDALGSAGIADVMLDLGDARVLRALLAGAALDGERLTDMARALASKDAAALALLSEALPPEARAGLQSLLRLYGGNEVLDAARTHAAGARADRPRARRSGMAGRACRARAPAGAHRLRPRRPVGLRLLQRPALLDLRRGQQCVAGARRAL